MAEHNKLGFDAVEKEVYLKKNEKAFSLLRLRKDFLLKMPASLHQLVTKNLMRIHQFLFICVGGCNIFG